MIHRESTIKISRNGFQESSRRGNVLSQDNIARYQLRDEFHDSLYFYFERDAKWILSRINREYNAAFLCKGQVTSLLIVVYLIEQDNTPIRVWREREKKKSKKGSIRAIVARGIFVEKFDDASGRAEETYRSAQKKLESVLTCTHACRRNLFSQISQISGYHRCTYLKQREGSIKKNCIKLVRTNMKYRFFLKNVVCISFFIFLNE